MFDIGIAMELEAKRREYGSRETDICKGCKDRVGIPCLKSVSCTKRNGDEENKNGD